MALIPLIPLSSPNKKRATMAILLLTLLARPAFSDEVKNPPTVSREMIIKAWAKREQQVKSAQFEWTENRHITDEILMPGESRVEPDVPQYNVTSTLSLKKNQIRHTYRKEIWQVEAPRGENQFVSVSSEDASKVYLPPGYVTTYPRGHESRTAGSNDLTSTYLKPFLWCYRSSLPDVLIAPLENFEITGEQAMYLDRDCIVLRYQATPTAIFELWLDPSRDFLIVRQLYMNDGHLAHQLDVNYQQHGATQTWIPQDWHFAMLNKNGAPVLSVNGELSRAKINPELPESEFEFEFPPGTWVHGDRSREHIVMANGEQRNVSVGERRLPYQILLAGKGRDTPNSWRMAWIRINIALFVAACIGLVYRWHRTRRLR